MLNTCTHTHTQMHARTHTPTSTSMTTDHFLRPQEKSNQEIDFTYKLKVQQQRLEQEEAEHMATKVRLLSKNQINQATEEVKGERETGTG